MQPPGWIHIDGSNRAFLASRLWPLDKFMVAVGAFPPTEFGRHMYYHNLFKPLPFAPGTVAAIYAGELWEHFEYDDSDKLTARCFSALAPGGVLRVCVPDGPHLFGEYLEKLEQQRALPRERRDPKPLHGMMHSFFKDICTKPAGFKSMGHYHKWSFDEIQLIDMFERAGFRNVDRMKYHESRIPGVEAVERSDFLIVEGVKPR